MTSRPDSTSGATSAAHGIEPFYFGGPGKELFGCFHHPLTNSRRSCGVLLCHPIGPEYIRSHRAFRQLALRLAREGFPVLRFDYLGCGDSAGDFEDRRLCDWLSDVHRASSELRSRAGVGSLCIVGLRLGANLGLTAAADDDRVAGLGLWDPVLDGRVYAVELRDWQADAIARGAIPARPPHKLDGTHTEILGYLYSTALFSDIEEIDVVSSSGAPESSLPEPRASARAAGRSKASDSHTAPHCRILVIDTSAGDPAAELCDRLGQQGGSVEYRRRAAPQVWRQEPYRAVLPNEVLRDFVEWANRVFT